jgi:penicillin amidase
MAAVLGTSALGAPADMAPTERIVGPQLHAAVEIVIDHWGVPHIYAKNEADLFFAQGFNAARDRLFQIDMWRRRGLGQLAEVFGLTFIEQDKATRLFLFRGDMKREWLVYSRDAESIANNFVAGINAYIDWLETHPERMPFEFKKLNYKAARWAAEDVVRIRSHGLSGNLEDEVARARTACVADVKLDELRLRLEPAWQTRVPEGLDPCLPKDVLKVFDLATEEVRFRKEEPSDVVAVSDPNDLRERGGEEREESNNWVISAGKSATGRGIMANDPHRAYSEPSLRYIADLNSPTLHVTGIGEPAIPGVSNGHNDWIAFGGTYFSMDQEDLYVYELNPANRDEYKYGNRWERFRIVHDEIKVKGQAAVPVDLKFTRHGPVIFVEEQKNRAFAVRTDWLEVGTSPYMASLSFMRARNFEEFKQSLEGWGTPPINHVYADVKGNIGWAAAGFAPIRPNWDGLLPVPGDGRYEWAGRWKGKELPRIYNPESGFITTSNEMNLPAEYPYKERKLAFEWGVPFRHQRIVEVLSGNHQISIEDSMKLQNDVVSIPARRLVALLQGLSSEDASEKAALRLLKGWKAVLSKAAADVVERPDSGAMLDALEHPQNRFEGNATEHRNQLLLSTLGAAYQEMEKLQGSDPQQWRWGKLHFNFSEHPFSPLVDEETQAKINVGPIAKNGSGYTVNASVYRASDFRQVAGPSARLVIDVGNWDESRAVNHPGQSGDRENAHYRDLAPLWRAGEYFPLLYSREAVERAAEKKIELVP